MVNLENVEINSVSNRAAMGLPESYVPGCFDDISAEYAALRSCSDAALVQVLGDSAASPGMRFAAGTLLALLGDPRFVAEQPEMIEIPAATVTIGLAPDQIDEIVARYRSYGVKREWIEKECPAHQADVASFRIARYPVTNLEYRRFLEATGSDALPSSWGLGVFPSSRSNHPVYTVSCDAADAYVNWLAQRTGRHFRLPREVEWEYAAGGPKGQEFPWGERWEPDRANTLESGVFTTTPVGMFPAGASYFQLADMGGNVEEYVADTYWAYPGTSLIRDDLFVHHDGYRIARGGSFARFADLARCRRRHGFFARPIYAMGFRIAEDLG